MTLWQFLAGLPVIVWYIVLGLIGMTILFLGGWMITTSLMTLYRGGKIHVSKDGIEEQTSSTEPAAPAEEAKK